ncbi:hypothetical protein [Sphingomonas sp. ID0503]|uniref:hypothetical protein n=1 Tax=Sphingomonas sp. ID0503 TaxID=3399691 RepID=UPI003AFAC744
MTRPGPPPRWNEWAWLAHHANVIHVERLRRYPDLVKREAMTNLEARRGLDLAQNIAREWRALALLEPMPADVDRFLPGEKAQSLAAGCERYARMATRKGDEAARAAILLEASETLIFHYRQTAARLGPIAARAQATWEAARADWRTARLADAEDARRAGWTFADLPAAERKAA